MFAGAVNVPFEQLEARLGEVRQLAGLGTSAENGANDGPQDVGKGAAHGPTIVAPVCDACEDGAGAEAVLGGGGSSE